MLDLNRQSNQPQISNQESAELCFQFLVGTWGVMIHVCTRRNIGRRYFDVCTLMSLPLFWIWTAFTVQPDTDVGPQSLFSLLFIVMVVWQLMSFKETLFGNPVHSRYDGWPRVCDILPISEKAAKKFVEPAVVTLLAWAVSWESNSLASFIYIGALLNMLDFGVGEGRRRMRVMDMRDAEIEMDLTVETYDRHYRK